MRSPRDRDADALEAPAGPAPPVFVFVAPNYCRAWFIPIELARKARRSGQGSDRQDDRRRDCHDLPDSHAAKATPVCARRCKKKTCD